MVIVVIQIRNTDGDVKDVTYFRVQAIIDPE